MIRAFILATLTSIAVSCAPSDAPAEIERASGSVMWPDLLRREHVHVNRRLDEIEVLPPLQGGVLFVGDSITEGAPLTTMFPGLEVANHGIGGDTSEGVLLRFGQITRNAPDRLFLLIGTNDTNYTDDPDRIGGNILTIAERLNAALPETELYVISVLPRSGKKNAIIPGINAMVSTAAETADFVYLDLASAMRAPNGELIPALTYDSLHLNEQGYAVWAEVLQTCVRAGCPNGLAD
ncbi:MAG: GDSL-type esterase/lipase family protein [Pseudomonadota bacterium]